MQHETGGIFKGWEPSLRERVRALVHLRKQTSTNGIVGHSSRKQRGRPNAAAADSASGPAIVAKR